MERVAGAGGLDGWLEGACIKVHSWLRENRSGIGIGIDTSSISVGHCRDQPRVTSHDSIAHRPQQSLISLFCLLSSCRQRSALEVPPVSTELT